MNTFGIFACECGYRTTRIIGTIFKDGAAKRRRFCIKCEKSFTTYEVASLDYAILRAMKKAGKNGNANEQHQLDGGDN